MRRDGATLMQIAEAAGLSHVAVRKIINRLTDTPTDLDEHSPT
jgi:hypothetical protein